MSSPPVIVIAHQDDAGPGFIGDWLDARGITWSLAGSSDGAAPATAASAAGARAVITLGSSHSAYATEPDWIPRHLEYLAGALAAGTPVLGICFGAQALALAAGGTVARAIAPEVGWVEPETDEPALRGPWLSWHSDVIGAPPGAVEIARSPWALQAYTLGRHVGIQFHPEVTPAIWDAWAADEPHVVRTHVGDAEAFAAAVAEQAADLQARLFGLLDWWRSIALDD